LAPRWFCAALYGFSTDSLANDLCGLDIRRADGVARKIGRGRACTTDNLFGFLGVEFDDLIRLMLVHVMPLPGALAAAWRDARDESDCGSQRSSGKDVPPRPGPPREGLPGNGGSLSAGDVLTLGVV
jgi:hypothetical protein